MSNYENPNFISVGSLAETIVSKERAQSYDLVGKSITLCSDSQSLIDMSFEDENKIIYARQGENTSKSMGNVYLIRQDLYFVDFVNSNDQKESHSMIIDFAEGIATHVIGKLPEKDTYSLSLFERAEKRMCLSPIDLTWEHLAIGSSFADDTKKHESTLDLVGKRYLWHYSADETYEHNYLSENFYTWFCHSGSEKGLCDTDRCFYFKIREGVYYFIWIEKIIPTLGMVIEDTEQLLTWGKLYGYQGYDEGNIVNCPIAAKGEKIK